MHDLTDILSSLCEDPKHANLQLMIRKLQDYFLVSDGEILRLLPSNESLYGVGNIDIHIKEKFKNFDIEITDFDVAPADGFMVDDLIPKGEFNDNFSFCRFEDANGVEKLKVSFA